MVTVCSTICDWRVFSIWRAAMLLTIMTLAPGLSVTAVAQDDFYPLPQRNPGNFGFPWPPPASDEPGVTFNRRYMLDGHPELQFNPRPQDEIWLVSTREIADCDVSPSSNKFVCKHPVGTAWNRVPLEQLLDVQNKHSDKANVVFIHGNRTSEFWSRRRGKMAYQKLVANNPVELPPVRFIIWSWPSDEIAQPLKDFWKKMDRSVVDGRLFGHFLSRLDPQQPLSLLTYSMGTQVGFTGIETATLHSDSCPSIGMIAMAPVTHCQWPLTPVQMDVIQDRVHHLRFCRNSKDIAIRAYKTVCSLGCSNDFRPGADLISGVHHNVRQYDVSKAVGCEHNILGYIAQPVVRCELESLLLR